MQDRIGQGFSTNVIIVGGGLAGLIAANRIARAGQSVILVERAGILGGRAATQVERGIHFNLGPHALYCGGHAFRILRELGIAFSGGYPWARGGRLILGDATFPLPRGLGELIVSRLFSIREKLKAVQILAVLGRQDNRRLDRVTLADWIEQAAGRDNLANFFRTLFRVGTYIDDAERLSAGAALDQLKLALQANVWYLDGGWQTLIDGLRTGAIGHGVTLRTEARAVSVRAGDDSVFVRLTSGEELRSRAAILAVDADSAGDLLDLPQDAPLVRWSQERIPVRAACLDVALSRLPDTNRCVAFGLDRPLYYSVHSASARLGPPGVAVLHVMMYLRKETVTNARHIESELEHLLDRLQPGWQDLTLARRFLPGMTVAHSLPRADQGGLQGRPDVTISGRSNVLVAGDWVGPDGLLADASAASAWEASGRVLAALTRPRPTREGSLVHAPS